MKKWISVLCIALLLCSVMTLAVSAAGTIDDPVVFTSSDFNMVKVPAGATYYVSFTDTTGESKRQISINSSTDKVAGYVVTYGEMVENSDENGFCNIMATPGADNTYLLSITNNATKQATFFISYYTVEPYVISDTPLYEGENVVTTMMADTTLFVFEPVETGIYEIAVSQADVILSHWNGSVFYVTGLAEETTEGKLEIACSSLGQSLLIGLNNVGSANVTITKTDEYVAPTSVEYVPYVNKHTPIADFQLPDNEMVAMDITTPHTLVLGADGIYRYGTANGPVVYVDMTGVTFADLRECFYPSSGGDAADRMRGTYIDAEGKTCGYDFLSAMRAYADALDAEGYYYLTVDLANYLQMYGKDQGWYNPEYSPFEAIQNGNFIDESAWLISTCYDPTAGGVDPVIPEPPVTPDEPGDEPQSPATGDMSAFGAVVTLLLSSAGALSLCKKRNF